MVDLYLFNTLSGKEEVFTPKDEQNVKMYVCGPTVYERPHLGNARSIVCYDFLYRILNLLYKKVTYVRNITDVDDKIINKSKDLKISPEQLTARVIKEFEEDTLALNCLKPSFEPRATEYIGDMLLMIRSLIEKGHAYVEGGDVMFSVNSCKTYGKLSNRKLEDLNAGARVDVSDLKRNEHDFVLWKKVEKSEYGFESEFSYGRPGWHIECSAMSTKILGMGFDIHGGGADLQFPHHENEIAQSECTFEGEKFARYWVHNGFLTIEGEKMSKSLGNFKTVKELLDEGFSGIEVRLALLTTHYRKPLSFSKHLMETSKLTIKKFLKVLEVEGELLKEISKTLQWNDISALAQDALLSNLNTAKFIAIMHSLVNDIKNTNDKKGRMELVNQFYKMGLLLGIFTI